MGSVDDTAKLSVELIRIFTERRANLAYAAAPELKLHTDAPAERLIFIKAPQSIFYGQVVKVIDALKAAGAQPIGLQIDDLES